MICAFKSLGVKLSSSQKVKVLFDTLGIFFLKAQCAYLFNEWCILLYIHGDTRKSVGVSSDYVKQVEHGMWDSRQVYRRHSLPRRMLMSRLPSMMVQSFRDCAASTESMTGELQGLSQGPLQALQNILYGGEGERQTDREGREKLSKFLLFSLPVEIIPPLPNIVTDPSQ